MFYETKSGILDILFVTIHNERTEFLADLMNLYFLAKVLLLSLITQTFILGEKPHLWSSQARERNETEHYLTAYEKGTCTYLQQYTCLQFPLYLALQTVCNCFERRSDTLHWNSILTALKDTR